MTKVHRAELREEQLARFGPMDLPFLMLVLLLSGIGLVMVLSASFASSYYESGNAIFYFTKQAVFAGAGIAIMFVVSRMDYQGFRGLSLPVLLLSGILMIAVLIPGIGVLRNDARRWIDIKVTTFQPSELAKLAVILYFSASISKAKDKMRTFRYGVLPYGMVLMVIAVLLMMEPHLSGTILILGVGAALLFVGGVRLYWFIGGGALVAAAGYYIVGIMGYGSSRIELWKDPFSDMMDKGYQMVQSLYAIGSGGLLGVGLGKSRQKFLYLPEEHNDFIFAITCEELGFIGASIILILFALLIIRGYWLAIHSRDRFGSLLIVGITTLMAMQVFLNVAVVSNLVPATGISLPFFSYGGTALMIQLTEMGIVLSVSRQIPAPRAG
ncbi:putative lipid II flippase FtsW [Papillibacter cinnamivorans]|uniref:Probable peptidoglycan glycosyltransferase FtsW n=1 Tax=Papillibacter cinnamivorans DSM 12816 TaxID=1122930 RepID=A0A1W1YZ88_9FIRM|nr:putative lipid II flippase FtsW [Papillibacter cinnamivorans]SMC41509.1 cell division protein FtsW [Papillibacter cinnamivorans DSM 12816]